MLFKSVLPAIIVLLVCLIPGCTQKKPSLGIFDGNSDIGKINRTGWAVYDVAEDNYVIEGSGTNMWFGQDEFHYLFTTIKGDFIAQANVEFIGKGVNAHRKAGWIVRDSLEPDSPHVNATIHGDGLTSLQYRKTPGDSTRELGSESVGPNVIQLERRGNTFIMSTAIAGETFKTVELDQVTLADSVYVGIYVCSHDSEVSEKAVYSNVRISIPADKDFVPYKDYIGSRIEVMDIATCSRKVLYTAPNSLQAPNWTVDGRSLIYNSEGLLYNFNLETLTPTVINTDSANQNNNDHVLSFDGKYIGLSSHNQASGGSVVYIVPIEGGVPEQITAIGPSYLHGWSPDGQFLVFTGGRNDQYDIYKTSITEKQDIQLTNTPGLDDGSEYTPDGQFIYFNSNRTGTMQIWRMKPDGSDQEQITFDEYNNWFPHISPDGKWIVYLSFMPDIPSGDHPFYKHVYLRLMPFEGGDSKVIAYLYGGQGTINVPSWSPDSRKIAFVSNSKID